MGRGAYLGEAFSVSGMMKVAETITVFIALILHRHGDNGKYIFFSTAADHLQFNDSDRQALDTENLGNGTLVTFAILSPVLLLSYILDGRFAVQSLFLEWFWNLLGSCLFMGVGIKTCILWTNAKAEDQFGRSGDYVRNYDAALTMGAFCLLASILYFCDFLIAFYARKRMLRDPY